MPPASRSRSPARRSTSGRRSASSSYAIVGQPAGSTTRSGVRPPGQRRLVDVGVHDLPGSRRHPDRLDPASVPVRGPAARPEHLLQLRAQQRLAAAHGARSASPGRQGRSVADARRRRLSGGRRRADQVDRRRLHHVVELPGLAVGQPALGHHDDADRQRCVGRPAEHPGQLPAELGEGRRRRLHRQGDALRRGTRRSIRTRCCKAWESVFPGLVKPQSSIPSALLSAAALSDGPVQRAALRCWRSTT